jgi:hypothetical protein
MDFTPHKNKGDLPSMRNIYDSKHWDSVRNEELGLVTNNWNAAHIPLDTGVTGRPSYADMFMPLKPQETKSNRKMPESSVKSLTGETISPENFIHNNMEPFYKGSVTQNVDPFGNATYLERSTGRGGFYENKKEVGCFFDMSSGMGNVCGMKENTDFYKDHLNIPKSRNNEFPLEQVKVAPGLGLGYTEHGDGGFQQSATLDAIRPKTIDQLRPESRPKSTFELPMQGPKANKVQNRGIAPEIVKNRPENFHVQTSDQWLRTTGAVSKPTEVPEFVVKPTARVDGHVEYMGIGRADAPIGADDYGRESVIIYTNNRDDTQKNSIITNISSVVKAITAPFFDILKHSQKEYTLDASRTFGNMSAQIPEKPTVYDPVNHMMRTTIKETTIHDTTIMNPRGNNRQQTVSGDKAKQTVRETMEITDTTRNINAHTYKTVVINPEVIAKKTIKETTVDKTDNLGNITGKSRGGYTHVEVQIFNTQKELMSDNDYTGISGAQTTHYPRLVDTEYNAEIDGTREMMNMKAGYTPNAEGISQNIGVDGVDMEVKKLASDRENPRVEGNVNRIYQIGAEEKGPCAITKDPQKAHLDEKNAGRLDGMVLSVLKENPYNLSINPF